MLFYKDLGIFLFFILSSFYYSVWLVVVLLRHLVCCLLIASLVCRQPIKIWCFRLFIIALYLCEGNLEI